MINSKFLPYACTCFIIYSKYIDSIDFDLILLSIIIKNFINNSIIPPGMIFYPLKGK